MNAIIYARVSTQGQAEKGIAIPDQLQKSRQFADESNMQDVAEFTDVESGGTHDRDGFNELELMLARGKADVVIVHESSRLSRNLWEKGLLYEQLKLMGVRLFYSETGEEVDLSDDSFLKRTVDDMMDHEERLRIRKRTIKGRYLKAERGEPVLTGRIPFGYRKVGKGEDAKLAKHEPELAVVREIFEWYTKGNGKGVSMSIRAIVKKLNGPPKRDKNGMVYYEPLYPSTAPNKLWTATRISTILHQEMYTGVTYYGKTRTKSIKINHKRKTIVLAKLPKDKWVKIPVPHLATIDRETFEAVHARKERNVKLQLRNNRHKYLMTEHLRCSCGRSIGGYKDTRGNPRYKCRTYWNSSEAHCIDKEHSITCSKIDNLVWDWICNLLSDEQALEEGLNKMIEGNKDETGDKRNKLEKLKNLITKHENSIERLINELSEGIYDDEFTRKIFQEKINENKEVIKELQKGRKQLEAELAQVELTEDFRQEIHSIAAQVRDNLVGASWEQKRAVMDKLDLKAVFRYNGGDRLLDLSCSLSPDGLSYDLQENNLL